MNINGLVLDSCSPTSASSSMAAVATMRKPRIIACCKGSSVAQRRIARNPKCRQGKLHGCRGVTVRGSIIAGYHAPRDVIETEGQPRPIAGAHASTVGSCYVYVGLLLA